MGPSCTSEGVVVTGPTTKGPVHEGRKHKVKLFARLHMWAVKLCWTRSRCCYSEVNRCVCLMADPRGSVVTRYLDFLFEAAELTDGSYS